MFDYEKFKKDIVIAMENVLRKWTKENGDIYIIALDLSRDMESVGVWANTGQWLNEQADITSDDYWYYKYCEEEWQLCEVFDGISSYMRTFVEENKEQFTNSQTLTYTETFDAYCDKMIESCKLALKCFRESINEDFPKLLLTFNIREYLDNDERIEAFSLINSKEATKEYMEHIDEFN